MSKGDQGKMQWYCVRAQPKRERVASESIRAQLGLEVFCPQIRFQRKTARGLVWFQEALFPGYFFARFDLPTHRRAVAHAAAVLYIPEFAGQVYAVPASVIDGIRAELDAMAESADGERAAFLPGQKITIQSGTLQGIAVQVVKTLPAGDRVKVLLDMMGALVEAELPAAALEQPQTRPLRAGG